MSTLEALLRRERALVAAGLAALTLLAWSYIWFGAGMGMSALTMTRFALFPHTLGAAAGVAPPGFAWLTVVGMWWVMMIAMMTPSATPLVLLYGRVLRQSVPVDGPAGVYASSTFIVLGYLLAWLGFSILATSLQYALQQAGLVSAVMLWSRNALLSAAVLVLAGLYQLTPLKRACLVHCRSPVQFLTRHWRPGRFGALVMGLGHGVYCVGCCWVLMGVLFVGGIMNLAWIALLTVLVLAEKVFPAGIAVSRLSGGLFILWGLATLAV